MAGYTVALVLHFTGLALIAGGISFEWIALGALRRTSSLAAARTWLGALPALRFLFLPAVLLLLGSGTWMAMNRGGWAPFSVAGAVVVVLFAIIGNAHGARRGMALTRDAAAEHEPMSDEFATQLRDPGLWVSLWVRTLMVWGLMAIMVAKPGAAGVIGTLAVCGVAGGVMALRRPVATTTAAAQPEN